MNMAFFTVLCFVIFISREARVIAKCHGSLNISSLRHELIVDTETSCTFQVFPPEEVETIIVSVQQVKIPSENIEINNKQIPHRSCFLMYTRK